MHGNILNFRIEAALWFQRIGNRDLTRARIHHECDVFQEIEAFSSEIRLTAPRPWEGIVSMTNARRD